MFEKWPLTHFWQLHRQLVGQWTAEVKYAGEAGLPYSHLADRLRLGLLHIAAFISPTQQAPSPKQSSRRAGGGRTSSSPA